MGAFFSSEKKDDMLLDFGNMNTENMSSTIPYMKNLNANARALVDRLNIKTHQNTAQFNDTENYDMYKLFEKTQNISNNNNNFSETSPFITSDVYKNLVTNNMKGGANEFDEDENESSSSESIESSEVKPQKGKKDKKGKHKKASTTEINSLEESSVEIRDDMDNDIDDMEGGSSYESSSAHTDDIDSASTLTFQKHSKKHSKKRSQKSNKKNTNRKFSDSINTSDINMISVE